MTSNLAEQIARLAGSPWSPARSRPGHPLATLDGPLLGSARLVTLLGPQNRVGAWYFQLFAHDPEGRWSREPALAGLFNSGRYPAQNWVEIMSCAPSLRLDGDRTFGAELRQSLFQALADLLPAGGHMMVEYESPQWRDTASALDLGAPPVATELGLALRRAGCGCGFRNWYISEGWSEGPRKLQGYKALNADHRRQKAAELLAEVRAFLGRAPSPPEPTFLCQARHRATGLLSELAREASAPG